MTKEDKRQIELLKEEGWLMLIKAIYENASTEERLKLLFMKDTKDTNDTDEE